MLKDPDLIPIIHYGISGLNCFSEFDCCYCLNSYNVNAAVLDEILQDLLAPEFHVPLEIRTDMVTRRRTATVMHPRDAEVDLARLAQGALRQQEMGTVIQAIGRVRPFTHPREVILMQLGEHPQLPYDREFISLASFRSFFQLETRRSHNAQSSWLRVQDGRSRGLSQSQVATDTNLSLSTVKRCWAITPSEGSQP
jgi:hypothetical protein